MDCEDDDEWHLYQTSVASVLCPEKLVPPVGDPQRRLFWGALSRMHKKMIAQLEADDTTPIAPIATAAPPAVGRAIL